MKLDYKQILDNNLSINSYLWPKELSPYEFIKNIVKSKIKNVGLHTDFIENYGVENLKEELKLNNLKVTSLNSVGYFTDPKYYNQNEKILNYAKILNPELVCVITGGINGGPNPLSNEYIINDNNLKISEIRKESTIKICKRTALGKLLKSFFVSSNMMFADSIMKFLNFSNIIKLISLIFKK